MIEIIIKVNNGNADISTQFDGFKYSEACILNYELDKLKIWLNNKTWDNQIQSSFDEEGEES